MKEKQLVERKQIEKTPFTAIKNQNDWFLTCGKYRMSTKRFESYEETTEWIEQNQWELMATFTSIVAEETVREIMRVENNSTYVENLIKKLKINENE